MHRDLTVLENVLFSAFFRSPQNLYKIIDLLDKLRILKSSTSIIGDELKRGISGGN
jgi:hypothetical protein